MPTDGESINTKNRTRLKKRDNAYKAFRYIRIYAYFSRTTKKLAAPTAIEQWGDSKLLLSVMSLFIKLITLSFQLLNLIGQKQQYLCFLWLFIAAYIRLNNRAGYME
ncbi:MAG: hypothetical protein ACI8R1_001344 [Psychrobacter glaciei]|jgi:hypothetical protein